MAIDATLKDLLLNLKYPDPAMDRETIIRITNENTQILLENLKILYNNIKEVRDNG